MSGPVLGACLFAQKGDEWLLVQRQRGEKVEFGGAWLPPVYAPVSPGESDPLGVLLKAAPQLCGPWFAGLLEAGRGSILPLPTPGAPHTTIAGYLYRYDPAVSKGVFVPGEGLGNPLFMKREDLAGAREIKTEHKDGVPDEPVPYLFAGHLALLRRLTEAAG